MASWTSATIPSVGIANVYAVAGAGMQRAQDRLADDAHTVAEQGPEVDAMVDIGVQSTAFAASAATLRAEGKLAGSLLDVLA